MSDATPKVGSEIDAWCTRCKRGLDHTIVAMLDGKVKRVQCLTCEGQHNYTPSAKRSAEAKEKPKAAPRPRQRRLPPDDGRPARDYTLGESFAEHDMLQHPTYGRGRVVRTRGDKIDVEFPTGAKVLLHGKR